MKAALLKDNVVVNVIVVDEDTVLSDFHGYVPCNEDVAIGWSYISGEFHAPTPVSQASPTVNDFRYIIQALVDETANERQYDSGVTLASYVNSTIPQWAAEAQAFVAWRDAVWLHALTELDKVQSGARSQPTIEDFIAELPTLEWPE